MTDSVRQSIEEEMLLGLGVVVLEFCRVGLLTSKHKSL